MKRSHLQICENFPLSAGFIFLSASATASGPIVAEPPAACCFSFQLICRRWSNRAWLSSIGRKNGFIVPALPGGSESETYALRKGRVDDRRRSPPSTGADLPGAMLHDWRGTAFAPGATAADFEQLMRDYNAYPQHFSPQVLEAKVLAQHGDFFRVLMRVRQKHVITVMMDTTYDITYGRLDARHGFSTSRSTRDSRDRLARRRL